MDSPGPVEMNSFTAKPNEERESLPSDVNQGLSYRPLGLKNINEEEGQDGREVGNPVLTGPLK